MTCAAACSTSASTQVLASCSLHYVLDFNKSNMVTCACLQLLPQWGTTTTKICLGQHAVTCVIALHCLKQELIQ